MTWMQTFTGLRFDVFAPVPNMVDVRDIAHALSLKCRYNGHTSRLYSVAEHSVRLCDYMRRDHTRQTALAALMHDCAEAYLPDIVRPIKGELPGWQYVEDNVEACIVRALNLPYPWPQSVKEADTRIIQDERRALLLPIQWGKEWNKVEPLGIDIPAVFVKEDALAQSWEVAFLERWESLQPRDM